MNTEWLAAVTALVAVVLGPVLTYWQVKANRETTERQISAAADANSRQIGAAADATAAQLASAASTARAHIYATVVSSNRQAWINEVRDTVAEAISVATLLGDNSHASFLGASERATMGSRLTYLVSRVDLFLNPGEQDNQEVVGLLRKLTNLVVSAGPVSHEAFQATRDAITATTRRMLKREWDRVRNEAKVS